MSESKSLVVVRSGSRYVSDLSIGLHPLAILNISDYYTRMHLSKQSIYGGLIGKQTGREISIEQSFEFRSAVNGELDGFLIMRKLEQFKSCFEDLDFIGWFYIPAISPYEPSTDILQIHEFLSRFHNDTPPLLLVMDPAKATSDLPIIIYETLFTEDGSCQFAEVPHRIESDEAEHIGVLYVAKKDQVIQTADIKPTTDPSADNSLKNGEGSSVTTSGNSSKAKTTAISGNLATMNKSEEIISQLSSQSSAINMLYSRIEIVQEYLTAVLQIPQEQLTSDDFEILRQMDALVGRLGTEDLATIAQGHEFDGLLASMLGVITKGVKYGLDLNMKRQIMELPINSRLGKTAKSN
ncbi:uncharacterized protein V1516DRAFT_674083 [Lipomyces oligophaga]|uniref:uncharacterized protein n=1 Tax=Lipomyces oligophaga TaxID=45792 RepID=UPI0034CDBD47